MDAPVLLGDVVFVRQTNSWPSTHCRHVVCTSKTWAKGTFTLDPPEHEILRQKLNPQNVTIQFDETPLNAAIQELSRQVQADLRLDVKVMAEEGISERTEVSLKMTDRPLNHGAGGTADEIGLTWYLDDGVLWITPSTVADSDRLRIRCFRCPRSLSQ